MATRNLKELQEKYTQGINITFDLHPHPRIPNQVLYNGAIAGDVKATTVKAFKKWLVEKTNNN